LFLISAIQKEEGSNFIGMSHPPLVSTKKSKSMVKQKTNISENSRAAKKTHKVKKNQERKKGKAGGGGGEGLDYFDDMIEFLHNKYGKNVDVSKISNGDFWTSMLLTKHGKGKMKQFEEKHGRKMNSADDFGHFF